MDITHYTSYFHDGEVLDIIHKNDNIEMFLESAEIASNSVQNIPLSKNNRLKGKLHIEGVKLILNNGSYYRNKIKMIFPDNDLLHLKIEGNVVFCEVGWRGDSGETDFSDLEIHAKNIWWENLPNLLNES